MDRHHPHHVTQTESPIPRHSLQQNRELRALPLTLMAGFTLLLIPELFRKLHQKVTATLPSAALLTFILVVLTYSIGTGPLTTAARSSPPPRPMIRGDFCRFEISLRSHSTGRCRAQGSQLSFSGFLHETLLHARLRIPSFARIFQALRKHPGTNNVLSR